MTPYEIVHLTMSLILGGLVVYFMGKIDGRMQKLETGLNENSKELAYNTKALNSHSDNIARAADTSQRAATNSGETLALLRPAREEYDRSKSIPRQDPPSDRGGSGFRRSQPGNRK